MTAHTCFDCDAVAGFALAVTVLCQRGGRVMPSTEQTCQVTADFPRNALVLVAIRTDSGHREKLS